MPADQNEPKSIVGMIDADTGKAATIYTPPERLRRDPARWPTPQEFVEEWEQHTPERRHAMAERIINDAQIASRCFVMAHEDHIALLELGEAKLNKIRSLTAHLHTDLIHVSDITAILGGAR